jgi:hypothetical protein
MALPVTIPNTFANATAAIPLSQLDANFNTLSNAVNGLNSGSETLANLKATTANVVTLTVTGNATIGDASTDTVTLNSTLTANTAVIFSAGTSAAPSITFTGDTNTGIFSPAADTIAFAEGGVEAMRIDSSGLVMIGTSSGAAGLTVYKNGTTWTGAGANTYSVPAGNVFIQTPAIGSQDNWIGSTGGYGVTSGSSNLLLQANINNTSQQAGNYIGSEATGAASAVLTFGRMIGAATTGGNATKSEAMRIDSSGNVGIGASSPGAKLDVAGSIAVSPGNAQGRIRRTTVNGSFGISLQGNVADTINDTNPGASVVVGGGPITGDSFAGRIEITAYGNLTDSTSNIITFQRRTGVNTTAESARIDANGNLTVGTTTTAEARFFVGGTAATAASSTICRIGNADYTTDTVLSVAPGVVNFDAAGTVGGRFHISSGGEVRIAGTTDQGAYNLQVQGTGVWGAGAYVNGSDERIKEDIAPIASGLDVIQQLNPVTYRYKEEWSKDQSVQTGFIAQELLTALEGQVYVDGVVQQGGEKGYYSVAYQNIIPILTKAIQELKAELDTVKAELATLKG